MESWTLPAGNPEKGKHLYKLICTTCHTCDASMKHHSGPNLYQLWGREASTVDGFNFYKDNPVNKGIIWDDKTLWEMLERKHIPNTSVIFRLLANNKEKRADLLSYMKRVTSGQK
ncbi:c-type cytochrome [Salmonella sp. s51944]|uniref:c-type cytochrome n=1 Tax=Salmonella sp. s51944 TaxID=3159655 RepID=UPI0039812487